MVDTHMYVTLQLRKPLIYISSTNLHVSSVTSILFYPKYKKIKKLKFLSQINTVTQVESVVGNHFYKQLRIESTHKAMLLAGTKQRTQLTGTTSAACQCSIMFND